MIALTNVSGEKMYVNALRVEAILPREEGVTVVYCTGTNWLVQESVDKVRDKVKGAIDRLYDVID